MAQCEGMPRAHTIRCMIARLSRAGARRRETPAGVAWRAGRLHACLLHLKHGLDARLALAACGTNS